MIEVPISVMYILLFIVYCYGVIAMLKFNWFYEQDRFIVFVSAVLSILFTLIVSVFIIIGLIITNIKFIN